MNRSVEQRLTALEKDRPPGECHCIDNIRVEYADLPGREHPPALPEVCEVCGMPRITLRVIYDDPPGTNNAPETP